MSLVSPTPEGITLDYEPLEILRASDTATGAAAANGELVAILQHGARPASNWLTAATPYFARPDVASVVVPSLTPASATLRERAAAAVLESWLGGGSRRSRYFPGNVHVVRDHVADSFVIRRSDYVDLHAAGAHDSEIVERLAERGRLTVYTPDTLIATTPEAVFGPHLGGTLRHATARGAAARRTRGRSLSSATTLSLVPAAGAVAGVLSLSVGPAGGRRLSEALVVGYGAIVAGSSLLAALRFRSARVGLLAAPALVLTQASYVAGFMRGLARGR